MKKKNWQKKKRDNNGNINPSVFYILVIFSVLSCVGGIKSGDNPDIPVTPMETTALAEDTVAVTPKTRLELYLDSLGYVNIKEHCNSIIIDLKYATADNFTGKILYSELSQAYLHPYAMEKLQLAQQYLKSEKQNLSLLVYDALRPLSVQKEMYDVVKDTPYKSYVANPHRKSLHNYGMAVDLTICDENNVPLDMGTEFDFFGKKAGINNEEQLIAQGILSREQVNNRKLLRNVMKKAGFFPIKGEWWHFNACSLQQAARISSILSDL